MSIHVEINDRCTEGSLSLLLPALPRPPKRAIYVSTEILTLLYGPWDSKAQADRCMILRASLDNFILGEVVSVAKISNKAKKAFLSQLKPPSEGLWEIRSLAPKPSMRILGGFAERDVFVALAWSERIPLGGEQSQEWKDIITLCKSEWRKIFPVYRPISGSDFYECISDFIFV